MQPKAHFIKCVGLILGLLSAVLWIVLSIKLGWLDKRLGHEVNDNPDKFYLFATNSSYNCTFTYDPRAADEWLFHTGGPVNTNR